MLCRIPAERPVEFRMKMTSRWYGKESDLIPRKYIRRIPGMSGMKGNKKETQA